ncbi:hypothetical protein ABRQ22_17440 [Cellulosimicrobium sp. ES-005]|uniref:Uncharacterized protein n=1 Tax=Cellulosimicrobium sp. ES-005 TaxID=3163031 RepID=A0AAU8FZP6_9MICO
MTATTEGDLLTDLARLQDEAVAVVEAFENEPDMDTPEWHEFMVRVRGVSRRLNETVRLIDQGAGR